MSKLVQGEGAYAEIAARYPAKHVRLNKNKRADFKQLKTDFLKENGRKEWKKKVADEKSANHLARLRWVSNNKRFQPYFEGSWKQTVGRDKIKPLTTAWVKYHFERSFVQLVQSIGNKEGNRT